MRREEKCFPKKIKKDQNNNDKTSEPKRNRNRIVSMTSDTRDHCATATTQQFSEFLSLYIVTLSIIES